MFNPSYTSQDVNLAKAFLKAAVTTFQLSEPSYKDIIKTLSLALDNKQIQEQPEEKWLTVKKSCEMLQISKPTIYKMFNDGTLKKIKVRRSTRIAESDILKLRGEQANNA